MWLLLGVIFLSKAVAGHLKKKLELPYGHGILVWIKFRLVKTVKGQEVNQCDVFNSKLWPMMGLKRHN